MYNIIRMLFLALSSTITILFVTHRIVVVSFLLCSCIPLNRSSHISFKTNSLSYMRARVSLTVAIYVYLPGSCSFLSEGRHLAVRRTVRPGPENNQYVTFKVYYVGEIMAVLSFSNSSLQSYFTHRNSFY
jgi:hypothetical protein